MTEMEQLPRKWTDVFIRSRVSPCIFNVRRGHGGVATKIAVGVGLPTVTWSNVYDNFYQSTVLLNGLILFTGGPYGWDPGLKRGERVVGYRPFRLLCELMELTPPRHLKGEDSVPDPADLLAELTSQITEPIEPLRDRARLGLHLLDQSELVNLVHVLFEERI